MNGYTRWTRDEHNELTADILGSRYRIKAIPRTGEVILSIDGPGTMCADEARLVGVRLIEAAALAFPNVRETS